MENKDDEFPKLYFWLGEEAEDYDFETIEDYEAHLEHEEMTRLGY
jgi:hypothetical protein